jgi:transglutaminase-like putative cysteine protease
VNLVPAEALRPEDALGATDVIDADHPAIVARAAEIVAPLRADGAVTPDAEIAAVFAWVRDTIAYDMAPDLVDRTSWRASDTLERGWGFCQHKAVLLAALGRSLGHPVALAFQSVIDATIPDRFEVYLPQKRMRPHGLAAVWLDGRWQRLDPSLPASMCARRGLQVVEWTPGHDALLPATDASGATHCTIEEEMGLAGDLPDDMVAATMALTFLHTDEYKSAARRN